MTRVTLKRGLQTVCAAAVAIGVTGVTQGDLFNLISAPTGAGAVNLPGIGGGSPAGGSVPGLSSLTRNSSNSPSAGDNIEDFGSSANDGADNERQNWLLGIGGGNARQIHDFMAGATTGTLESSSGNSVSFSYNGGGTTVLGSYVLNSLLTPKTGGVEGDFYSNNLVTTMRVTNNGGSAQSYKLYSYKDIALTNIISGGGGDHHPADVDEKAVLLSVGQVRQWDTDNNAGGTMISEAMSRVSVSGDATSDGLTDINDLNVVLNNFNDPTTGGPTTGDFTFDDLVDINDLNVVLNNFNDRAALPSFAQVSDSNNLLASIGNGTLSGANNLDGTASVSLVGSTGDEIEHAFEWEFTLAPGESFFVQENLDIIPEPTSFGMLGIGVGLLTIMRRRSSS